MANYIADYVAFIILGPPVIFCTFLLVLGVGTLGQKVLGR